MKVNTSVFVPNNFDFLDAGINPAQAQQLA